MNRYASVIIMSTLLLIVVVQNAIASEYCINRFEKEISNASAALASSLKRQVEIDKRISAIASERDSIAGQIASVVAKDPSLSAEYSRQEIKRLSDRQTVIKKEQDELEVEGYANNDRIVGLRTVVPANLQGQLKGCMEAVGPVNTVVNFSIQALALVATAGASTALPKKALYVDMGEVLHGKPLGGDSAAIPAARDEALKGLGIGGDAAKVIRDPKCIFGGCN